MLSYLPSPHSSFFLLFLLLLLYGFSNQYIKNSSFTEKLEPKNVFFYPNFHLQWVISPSNFSSSFFHRFSIEYLFQNTYLSSTGSNRVESNSRQDLNVLSIDIKYKNDEKNEFSSNKINNGNDMDPIKCKFFKNCKNNITKNNILNQNASLFYRRKMADDVLEESVHEVPQDYCIKEMKNSSRDDVLASMNLLNDRKYIYILKLYEQLTKAKRHLTEVAYLAQKFNRTLILPRVGNSRVGSNQRLPFCTYFNENFLGNYLDWVTEDYLFSFLETSQISPSFFFFCIFGRNSENSCFTKDNRLERIFKILKIAAVQNSYAIAGLKSEIQNEENVFRILSKYKHVDIIFYSKISSTKTTRLHPPASIHVRYSSYNERIAKYIISRHLKPRYIAIHLRFEYISRLSSVRSKPKYRARIDRCVNNLVKVVKNLKRLKKIVHVFIASDVTDGYTNASVGLNFGLDFGLNSSLVRENNETYATALSTTWKTRDLIKIAVDGFKKVRSELKARTMIGLESRFGLYDSGVQGILDKLVCAESDIFVAGNRNCGGGGNYHFEILKIRRRLKKTPLAIFRD